MRGTQVSPLPDAAARSPLSARRAIALLLPLLAALPLHACTVCGSKGGRQLRAGLFDGHFLHHLGIVLLPFPVLAASVVVLHFSMPFGKLHHAENP